MNNEITHGIIQKPNLKCPVQFWHYVPTNLEKYLFIIILSKGVHNHPAPPPVKTPVSILNDLKDIIYNEDILDLTAHKLLSRVPLPQLHLSLNNLSKLDALIASKKRAEHPYRQNIYGVAYLLMKQSNNKNPYIRTIRLLNNGQYLILCGYKQQIEGLRKSKYIEIDMSFKRVHGPINEWEICAYSIGCILADEHRGQALELGQYLNQKYPIYSPTEHLEYIYKICTVHFKRNIRNKASVSKEIKKKMYSILQAKSQNEIIEILNNLEKYWVQDKKQNWILAALSSAFTKMIHNIWINTPFTTNASESAHATINRTGRNLSLIAAIQRSADFDSHQWSTAMTYEKTNVQDSY
ncbi:5333_t:CDS:2 [Cetraspora pellucida]|uniref:5333_t:CDS:1 n=1 Tax=Cetraspora pellucida TaxID=1433469 RepID=A0ACA9M6G6_9GLOM|nr:5333_t:CDS:2 [Cetraspora pellucida]